MAHKDQVLRRGYTAIPLGGASSSRYAMNMNADRPNFHDGYLTGLRVYDRALTIYLRTVDGREHELTLTGLESLVMDDFREGNIISRLIVLEEIADIDFDRLFVPPHPAAAEQYHTKHSEFITRQKGRIASGEARVVIIEPSYGADLIAMCESVVCQQV